MGLARERKGRGGEKGGGKEEGKRGGKRAGVGRGGELFGAEGFGGGIWGWLGRMEMAVEDGGVGVGVGLGLLCWCWFGLVVLCCVGRRVDGSVLYSFIIIIFVVLFDHCINCLIYEGDEADGVSATLRT